MPDKNERFELLLKEIEMIQSKIDKYDLAIFRIRQITSLFMISLLVASYSSAKPFVSLIALVFAGVGFIYEHYVRARYVKGLVSRHKLGSELINFAAVRRQS